MPGSNYWQLAPRNEELEKKLARELSIPLIIARILINRGIRTPGEAETFLKPKLTGLHNPFLLKDMEIAVERIGLALKKQERILIYGDYDADGISGTALLVATLKQQGGLVSYYIPHRVREGYGLNKPAIAEAARSGFVDDCHPLLRYLAGRQDSANRTECSADARSALSRSGRPARPIPRLAEALASPVVPSGAAGSRAAMRDDEIPRLRSR